MQQKLLLWNVPSECHDEIINILITENFINTERFAKAFVHDKFVLDKWGKQKIAYQLYNLAIPEADIQEAFKTIDDNQYFSVCQNLALKKYHSLRQKKYTEQKIKANIIRYLLSKGFEYEIINQVMEKLFNNL